MLHRKIKSLVSKSNTLEQKKVEQIKLVQPEWTLFARMQFADKRYNQSKLIDLVQQQTQYHQRKKRVINIAIDDFNENHLLSVIQSLAEGGQS